MFYVELCKSKNNSTDIYEVDLFFDCRIKFEPSYFKRQIQCINCQRYGHPKSFCFRKARCVKYTRDHPTNCLRRKKSKDVSNAFCTRATIQPITKAIWFIRIYKGTFSQLFGFLPPFKSVGDQKYQTRLAKTVA